MLSFERCFESIGNWAVIAIEVKPVLVLAEISALVPEWPAKLRDESGDFTVFVLQGLGICVFFCASIPHFLALCSGKDLPPLLLKLGAQPKEQKHEDVVWPF